MSSLCCQKFCPLKGQTTTCSVVFNIAGGTSSFNSIIKLTSISCLTMTMNWITTTITITSGITSGVYTTTFSVCSPFIGLSQINGVFPLFYSTNGSNPISFGLARLSFSANSPVFTFPTIPSDATIITLFGNSITWTMF